MPLDRVKQGWRGPISESFRFARLGFRLKHAGLLRTTVRSAIDRRGR